MRKIKCLLLIIFTGLLFFTEQGIGKQRGFQPGEKIPEFSAVDSTGNVFNYKHSGKKALMLMFLSEGQKNSASAASDIHGIIDKIGKDAERLEVVIVVEDPESVYLKSEQMKLVRDYNVVIDSDYKLWGKFGIIATPTVIISDANDVIRWVRAGYGYDFIPDVRAHINQALGLVKVNAKDKEIQIKTLENDTVSAKMRRHLQMAQILSEKGKLKSAIAEVLKAQEMDPNSVDVKLELAELLCRTNQNQAALQEVDKITARNNQDRARVRLLYGWANRQIGKLDIAEKFLTEAKTLDPKSIRTLFELGRVYQVGGQTEKAMKLYYEALAIVLGEQEDMQRSQ